MKQQPGMRRSFWHVSGNFAPALEIQKRTFCPMTQLVQMLVVVTKLPAIFAWRTHRFHALSLCLSSDGTRVVALVRQQVRASIPSIKVEPWLQFAVEPAVTRIRTGIPCASTAKCILLLPPPVLCSPYLDSHLEHLRCGNAL